MKNLSHISVAFFGEYRPLYIEAATLAEARRGLLACCSDSAILSRFDSLWRDFNRQRKAGLSISSASHQCSTLSVALRDYPRDRFLDSVVSTLPPHPAIAYPCLS